MDADKKSSRRFRECHGSKPESYDSRLSSWLAADCLAKVFISKNPGNDFQKGCQKQQNEAANEEPTHPRSAVAFGDKRKQQREEPQQ
jgi:hypothetical protein